MPKDKTETHERIIVAAKAEFLEKGFEKASMREIGRRAGITSAGLYRHYVNKEDMFNALVEPAISAMKIWYADHMARHYQMIDNKASSEELFKNNAVELIKEVEYKYKEEFQLIFNCSQGTKYENFIHEAVEAEQKDMLEAINYMKEHGQKIKPITVGELHLLLSAYITALTEPIKHDWPEEEIEHGLKTIEEFFMPGWKKLLGY